MESLICAILCIMWCIGIVNSNGFGWEHIRQWHLTLCYILQLTADTAWDSTGKLHTWTPIMWCKEEKGVSLAVGNFVFDQMISFCLSDSWFT